MSKIMRNCHETAPKKCTCGRTLSKPVHGTIPTAHTYYNSRDTGWYIECDCHLVHVWSWHHKSNGCWKIRSSLPLFDSREITIVA